MLYYLFYYYFYSKLFYYIFLFVHVSFQFCLVYLCYVFLLLAQSICKLFIVLFRFMWLNFIGDEIRLLTVQSADSVIVGFLLSFFITKIRIPKFTRHFFATQFVWVCLRKIKQHYVAKSYVCLCVDNVMLK